MSTRPTGADRSPAQRVQVGDRVRVRQDSWVVTGIEPRESCTVYTLGAAAPRALTGAPPPVLRVLAPFDDVVPERSGGPPKRVGLRTWRRVCRALLTGDGPAGCLRIAASARMDLLAYQLEPAIALLRGHGCRLLLADEVGLGKTVQAGLAAAELLATGIARRLLVVTPSGLREQWAEECQARFGLHLAMLDHTNVRRMRAALPPDVNPWTTEVCVITSIDYVKRAEVLPLALDAPWDIVIVDEAHHLENRSDRHAAAHALCRRASYVLLLTATPHNGDDDAFDRLCGVGEVDDTCGGASRMSGRDRGHDPLVVFRRSRGEAGHDVLRRVHMLRVTPTPAERAMHVALATLTTAIAAERAHGSRHVWLMLTVLHKRALSGPYALAESAARRLAALESQDAPDEQQLLLPLRVDDASDQDDEAPAVWSGPVLADRERERELVARLVRAARDAVPHDSKLARLRRLLRSVKEPAIVFTEYRDTLLHLQRHVVPHAAVVHGGLSAQQRRVALAEFGRAGILLATDAAGEGLNLQKDTRAVVNLELPWNPMRLEQRIGRVDRLGQTRRVHVFHLVSKDTREDALLEQLATRIARASSRVGAPDPLQRRPAWDEEASARLVIEVTRGVGGGGADGNGDGAAAVAAMGTRSDTGSSVRRAPEGSISGPLPGHGLLSRFVNEAVEERQRLSLIRRIREPFDACRFTAAPPAGTRLLVARSTRRRTRFALAGGALALYRSTLTDASGRLVASHIAAVVLPGTLVNARALGRTDGSALGVLSSLGVDLQVGGDGAQWLAESRRVQQRLSDTLARRVRAIAAQVEIQRQLHQAGLFDRRAEQALVDEARARMDLDLDLRDRLRVAEALAHLSSGPVPEPVLLLTTSAAPHGSDGDSQ